MCAERSDSLGRIARSRRIIREQLPPRGEGRECCRAVTAAVVGGRASPTQLLGLDDAPGLELLESLDREARLASPRVTQRRDPHQLGLELGTLRRALVLARPEHAESFFSQGDGEVVFAPQIVALGLGQKSLCPNPWRRFGSEQGVGSSIDGIRLGVCRLRGNERFPLVAQLIGDLARVDEGRALGPLPCL